MKRIVESGSEMVIIDYIFSPENHTDLYQNHPVNKELTALERTGFHGRTEAQNKRYDELKKFKFIKLTALFRSFLYVDQSHDAHPVSMVSLSPDIIHLLMNEIKKINDETAAMLWSDEEMTA